ncbi:hypothetical protein GGTG_04762 [Gaeumannomyces tritici R3-111a-1]|uniref:Aminoglycoside phosphotransferase domain-containing protein n=1 Tax=Gaeumannomyces tritici (strain R3-111a-1) TaxID=644352 RepID=J3NU13_GAET3|nr:hypothetical protein GGTG_04762 [Gaeumannomyces tritici R3-111a-1]EJT79678.1 hypothetical protein GGTG_04762 [Gaeumannomyces tritici R3-111a-1]
MPGPNHAQYQERLDFIQQQVLTKHLGLRGEDLERTSVSPIHYDPECPFKYNNFVYHIKLPPSAALALSHGTIIKAQGQPQQQTCVPIPTGTNNFILRLTNQDAEGVHFDTRVENEIAIMTLASTALRNVGLDVVPRIFAWANGATSQGWILQERMPGTPGDEAFKTMPLDLKKVTIRDMAKILKGLQSCKLPDSIDGFGGLTFDGAGRIVSGPMSNVRAGPWPSYQEYYLERLQKMLADADANPTIQGWRANGVRERIDAFVQKALPGLFASLASKDRKVIVHGDFNTNNILVDPTSGRLTALIDYDFSTVLHPSFEFFCSFSEDLGQLQGWSGDVTNESSALIKAKAALREGKLTGTFPKDLPGSECFGEGELAWDWDLAKAWEGSLEEVGAERPSTMAGIENISDLDAMLNAILPWQLDNPDFLAMQSEDTVKEMGVFFGKELLKRLEHMGF